MWHSRILTIWLIYILNGRYVVSTISGAKNVEVDPNGYIMFCPCMGRFGNQADHYLGALAFAKGVDRTLVLPPWVEYRQGSARSVQVPFKTYFDVEAVKKYHRVIPMEDFFASEELSNSLWPESKRISFCNSKRQGLPGEKTHKGGACYAKSGNPFESFWDTHNVNFVGSELYGNYGLHYDVSYPESSKGWQRKYPPHRWPVIAFTGAPAAFPVRKPNLHLHKYLYNWSKDINEMAEEFIAKQLPEGPFVGIHLRNGIDFKRACDLLSDNNKSLFSSAQCVGYFNENGDATKEMCIPSINEIYSKVELAINSVQAKSVFVASDNDHMVGKLHSYLSQRTTLTKVAKLDRENPHLDLAILGRSSMFVGNCVSSFSAFVKRERDVNELPSMFFGFPTVTHDEL